MTLGEVWCSCMEEMDISETGSLRRIVVTASKHAVCLPESLLRYRGMPREDCWWHFCHIQMDLLEMHLECVV